MVFLTTTPDIMPLPSAVRGSISSKSEIPSLSVSYLSGSEIEPMVSLLSGRPSPSVSGSKGFVE